MRLGTLRSCSRSWADLHRPMCSRVGIASARSACGTQLLPPRLRLHCSSIQAAAKGQEDSASRPARRPAPHKRRPFLDRCDPKGLERRKARVQGGQDSSADGTRPSTAEDHTPSPASPAASSSPTSTTPGNASSQEDSEAAASTASATSSSSRSNASSNSSGQQVAPEQQQEQQLPAGTTAPAAAATVASTSSARSTATTSSSSGSTEASRPAGATAAAAAGGNGAAVAPAIADSVPNRSASVRHQEQQEQQVAAVPAGSSAPARRSAATAAGGAAAGRRQPRRVKEYAPVYKGNLVLPGGPHWSGLRRHICAAGEDPDLPTLDQLVVVEGDQDQKAVARAVNAPVYVCDGSRVLRDHVRPELDALPRLGRTLVILTDPDERGRELRGHLEQALGPDVLHAFIPEKDATSLVDTANHEAGNRGIEHVVPRGVQVALSEAAPCFPPGRQEFTQQELIDRKLAGAWNAAASSSSSEGCGEQEQSVVVRRRRLSAVLGLGRCRADQLLDALNKYMSRERFEAALAEVEAGNTAAAAAAAAAAAQAAPSVAAAAGLD